MTPQHRPIICVDMDEVIADALGEHLLRYNRDFRTNLTVKDLHGRWIWDFVPPERLHVLEQYMLSEDFFSVLGVMPHAQRVLAALQSRYEIFIATAAMEVPTSFNAKFNWLAQHFPFIPSTSPSSPARISSSAETNPSSAATTSSTTTPASCNASPPPAKANPPAKASSSPPQPTSTSRATAASTTGST